MSGGGGSGEVKETPYDKELASLASARFGRYQQKFVPAENFVIDKATDLQGLEKKAKDIASVDYGATFADGEQQLARGLGARGAAPSSGAFKAGVKQYGLDRGQSTASGMMDVANQVRDINAQNLGNLVSYGQGQDAQAVQSLQRVANTANRQAILDAQASLAAKQAIGQSIGQLAGYGIGYGLPSSTGTYTAYNTTRS